jgi:hypothetical protein
MSIETYHSLDAPLMDLVRCIGCEAAKCSELNFSIAQLDRVVASFFVTASGYRFQGGLICPSAEVGDEID